MSTSEVATPAGLAVTLAELPAHTGEHLGYTRWRSMTQERVDQFAEVTEDHNFIHVDPQRAAQTQFEGTIAHGYLTVSLLAPISQQLLKVTDASTGINYGMNKVRFPAPLPVGAEFRGAAQLTDVGEVNGALQATLVITVEVKDAVKPALVAECLLRYFA